MKNNSFNLLPNIFCVLQFFIEKITTNSQKNISAQPDRNQKQNQHKDITIPEQNTNKIQKKPFRNTQVRTCVKLRTEKLFNFRIKSLINFTVDRSTHSPDQVINQSICCIYIYLYNPHTHLSLQPTNTFNIHIKNINISIGSLLYISIGSLLYLWESI